MKKFGLTLLTAFVGGAMALGAYKIIETKYADNMSFEDKQKVFFASNHPATVTSSAGEVDFTQAAAAVTPAVVYIHTTYAMPKEDEQDPMGGMLGQMFGQRLRGQQGKPKAPQASGSGVIISTDGYIVTNNHVVDKAEKIQVTMNDHRILDAKVIGTDPNTDLALIKVSGADFPIVKLGNSDDVRVGEWVLAVGNPFNLYSTVTAGIVSAKGRGIGIIGQEDQQENASPFGPTRNAPRARVNKGIESFIQTDAAINPGNSGGALVNTKGELIGINSAIASHTGSYEGYGFAIPINLAKKVLNDIQKYGSVKRGYIGVNFVDLSDPERAGQVTTDKTVGLYVDNVLSGSGGEAAGLQHGDIITKVDGNPVYAASDLQEHVARLQPGDKVKVTFMRGNDEKTADVTLKADAGTAKVATLSKVAQDVFDKVGVSFQPLTASQKAKYKIASGMRVDQVSGESMFGEYLQTGSVVTSINKIPVNTVEEVSKALDNTRRGMLAISGINPDGSTFNNVFQVN